MMAGGAKETPTTEAVVQRYMLARRGRDDECRLDKDHLGCFLPFVCSSSGATYIDEENPTTHGREIEQATAF